MPLILFQGGMIALMSLMNQSYYYNRQLFDYQPIILRSVLLSQLH